MNTPPEKTTQPHSRGGTTPRVPLASILSVLFLISFLALCSATWIDFCLPVNPDISLNENRQLSEFPKIHLGFTALSQLPAKLEAYFNDQRELLASTPSIWPVRGYLSAGFGNRPDPFTGQRDFHPGLDISVPIGTKVHAPADGVVVSSGLQKGYGNALVIDHGFGVVTRYGHLDGFNVRPGQRIKRGEVIGFSGNTGRSTAPHVHYEVWVNNQARNPIEYIIDEYRSFG